jgi:murein DD-endopeptidase MepM/ murein hydrolase activator NlpD
VADLFDKLDTLTDSLGRALDERAGGGFGDLVQQPQRQARDWSSLLGGGGGVQFGSLVGPTQAGPGWADMALGGFGNGFSWSGASSGYSQRGPFDLSGFDEYEGLKARREAEQLAQQGTVGQGQKVHERGATGADPNTDQWRTLIDEAAAQYGIDGDAIQAVMMIESQGNPQARSGAGALGLMQVMPFHFQPGEDGMDPRTNVLKGASILADNYKRYGNWDSAVAAYLGAVDAQGNPTTSADMYGTTGIKYAQLFNEYYGRIKAARAKQQPAYGGAAVGLASLFGGQGYGTSQGFGRTPFSTGAGAGIYDFGSEFGLDGDSHTGWDIATPDGTPFYMPAGLSGTVSIAGGSGVYTDDRKGNAPGTGELRITLDNGTILILGHNSGIDVRAGQRVTAGMLLGRTGVANGAHLHLEVRVPDSSLPHGYRIVDPATLFGGGGGGSSEH